jgi:solute carrier family 24 (sodium/potassium/calcium exchanger), member 6
MGFSVMAYSACFGGPMLNILLGIGISGAWMNAKNGGTPYPLQLSQNLIISASGLLFVLIITLIWVVCNDWLISRKLGIFMISTYLIFLGINLAFFVH